MKQIKKIIFVSVIFFCGILNTHAQHTGITVPGNIVFSAIKGTISKPDSVLLPQTITTVKLVSGDTASFKILVFKKGKLILVFQPAADFVGINRAKLQVKNSTGNAITGIELTGLSTNGLEGENEAPLSRVVDALGYRVNIGWTSLANNSLPVLQGEELSPSLFHKAGKGKVEFIPVARYSPDFELPFGYYTDTAAVPEKHQVGVLAKTGAYPEHQCLFPAVASGSPRRGRRSRRASAPPRQSR